VNSISGGVEAAGLLIDGYVEIPRTATVAFDAYRIARHTYRHLVNSIEGGTTEVMHNILSERVLGPAGESRIDRDIARWEVCQS
jgi:alkylation response protein AidB-like acyl-CoA dehydrogenase